jgi:hypothetical protein
MMIHRELLERPCLKNTQVQEKKILVHLIHNVECRTACMLYVRTNFSHA